MGLKMICSNWGTTVPEAVIVSSTAPHCTCAVRMRSGSSAGLIQLGNQTESQRSAATPTTA